MVSIVASTSTSLQFSDKEDLNLVNDESGQGHYTTLDGLIVDDSLIESLPSLYYSEETKKEDTEDESEDEVVDEKPVKVEHMIESTLSKKAIPTATSQSPIESYSPQLNYSLYSPSPSAVSSVRSKKSIKPNYPLSTLPAAPSINSNIPQNSCSSNTAAQNSTFLSYNNKKQPFNTASSSSSFSPSNVATNIKMDIRSPPQPSQSTSRFMNALQRLRSVNKHQNTNNNSVAPADMKLTPSKSSLADKIKSKFQQQLDKKKNVKPVPNFSITRSSSISSLSNWSTRLSKTPRNNRVLSSDSSSCSESTSTVSSEDTILENIKKPPTLLLTKSISSHRLYNKTNPRQSLPQSRPRQTLRAVNQPHQFMQTTNNHKQKKKNVVKFTKLISVRETFSKTEYDRASDPEAVCSRLTPAIAQQIKEELNAYKLHEMEVHEHSRVHTHFFI